VGADGPPAVVPVDDPVPVAVLWEAPEEEVPEAFGWLDVMLEPGSVVEVDWLDRLPGWVAVTVPTVGDSPFVVAGVPSLGLARPSAGPPGATPPSLDTDEVPPVARSRCLTGRATVVDVERVVCVVRARLVESRAPAGGFTGRPAGTMIAGASTAGESISAVLEATAGAGAAWTGVTLATCARW
jgi:hypothetical protein